LAAFFRSSGAKLGARCHNIGENIMAYVDGFVIAVPKDRLEDYKEMARILAPIWKDHGALDYVECVSEDTPYGKLTSFPRAVYPSKEVRDTANKNSIEDPRVKQFEKAIPFDGKRMIFGGFTPFLGLEN
jgi:uncharacterized protein YbaA (DUF1428 family)